MTTELKPFEAIKYQTSDGENCTATKNNGVVTIRGDKNGVRQMTVEEFLPQFVKDQAAKGSLEKTPDKDTVSFSGAEEKPKKKGKGLLYSSLGAWIATNVSHFLFNRHIDKEMAKYDAVLAEKGTTPEVAKLLDEIGAKIAKGGKIFKALQIVFGIASMASIINYLVKNKKEK